MRRLLWLTLALLAACTGQRGQRVENLPTPAQIDRLATASYLTQNAPPPDYRGSVSFPQVDTRLNEMAGGHYIVHLEFNGVFAGTPRQTNATANAEIWFKQVGSSRRVVVRTAGELIGKKEDDAFEAVRLGPDAFLVRENACLAKAPDAETAADLSAGTLVGGVVTAQPTGLRATINNLDSWQYSFSVTDLKLPSIKPSNEGLVEMASGELWVAPKHNAVSRFYVNLNVKDAIIFDRRLPVTGQVILRYDLYDAGSQPNITVPFGC
jgi:hypothetical protein